MQLICIQADTLHFLDPTRPTPISSHQQDIQTNQIAFCWSGKKIFVTTGDGRVKIISYPDLVPIFEPRAGDDRPFALNGHTSSCISVAMQPTARYLATGGAESLICLWSTKNWICERTLIEMVGPVRSISFSFDGSYVVGGSDEGLGLEIAHVETGEYVHSVKAEKPCPVVSWHPSRYHLAYVDVGGSAAGLKIIGVDPDRK
jgi:THO complex subunit 3